METRLARARRDIPLNFGHLEIRSLETLKAHEERSRNAVQVTNSMDIELRERHVQPVRRISHLLLRTPFVDTLRISLSHLSNFKGNRLFHGVALRNLEHLCCSGIPHLSLACFVERHPALRSLSIGRCTSPGGPCTLNALATTFNLQEISGPASCIHGLVSGVTERVFVTWDPNDASVNKDTALFGQLNAVQAHVYLLSTQFFPEDQEFTTRLSHFLPDVSTLRLKEAPHHPGRIPASYPWSRNEAVWTNGLQNLLRLKTLEIETSSPPMGNMLPGEVTRELDLIRLLMGKRVHNLTDVKLRYSCEGGITYQSVWTRIRGSRAWTRREHSRIL